MVIKIKRRDIILITGFEQGDGFVFLYAGTDDLEIYERKIKNFKLDKKYAGKYLTIFAESNSEIPFDNLSLKGKLKNGGFTSVEYYQLQIKATSAEEVSDSVVDFIDPSWAPTPTPYNRRKTRNYTYKR